MPLPPRWTAPTSPTPSAASAEPGPDLARFDEAAAAGDGAARKRSDAHRHQGALAWRQRPDDGQEFLRPCAVDLGQQAVAGRRDRKRALTAIGDLLAPLDQDASLERRDQPAGGWRGGPDLLRP